MQVNAQIDTHANDFPLGEGSQVRILPRAQNARSGSVVGGLPRATDNRTGYKPSTNPFTEPYRVIFGLIVFPVLAAFVALLLTYEGPNQAAIFGWHPTPAGDHTHWCSEMSARQQTPELQAAVDAQRSLPEFAQLCAQ